MSESPIYIEGSIDGLSAVLSRLELTAEVYVSGDFCGHWAVDTSGSRRAPFHLIGKGDAWLHLDGEPQRRLSSGDLVIFPNDRKHIVASSAEVPDESLINADFSDNEGPVTHMVCGFFEFHNQAAWPLLDSLESVIVLELSDLGTLPQVRGLIDLMLTELKHKPPGFYTSINQISVLVFIHAIRQQIESGTVADGLLMALFDTRISRALSAIHQQFAQPWSLGELAAEAQMGRSSFARHFHDLVGMPAMQYLAYWRMQEATRLLESGNQSVWQIAEQCGYESEPAFRKAYKKVTGNTPGAVRREARAVLRRKDIQ